MKNDAISKKTTARIVYFALLLIFSFLGGFSFLGTRGAWFLALGIMVIIKQFLAKQIRFSLPFVITVVFALMLFTFRTIYSSFEFAYLVAYAFLPIAFFMLGQESSSFKGELLAIVVALAIGHIAYVTGNVIYTLRSGDVMNPQFGIITYYNFWTQEYEPRTFFSIDTTIVAGLGAALLVYPSQRRKWPIRVLGASLLLAYLISSVLLGVRSPIVVAPLVFVLTAIHGLIKETDPRKKIIGFSFFGGIVLLFTLFWIFAANNLFGLKDFLIKIPGFNRFISEGGSDNARIDHYQSFFEHWLEYPWGGMYKAGLLGEDSLGNPMLFHNGFLQIYTHGGFPLTIVALVLLVLLARQIVLVKRTPENGICLTLAISIIAALFSIFMIEPTITSGPFICSYLFLAGGYLTGQLAKQKQEKPFFVFGLNDWQETTPFSEGNLLKLILFVVFGILGGSLVSLTSGGPFYAISMLAASVLMFLLVDQSQYNVASWVKTAISFAFAAGVILLEFRFFPNPSLVFSIAKVMIGFFSYLLVRVIIIQKHDPEDGYRAFRNLFIRISKYASLPEEDLVN